MATHNVTFGTPNGFEKIAIELEKKGYGIERDPDFESKDSDESIMGWRSWNVTFPNGESLFVPECGGDEPMIMFVLYSIEDGRQFREDILVAGAIEHWDGEFPSQGFFWKRYFKNYERRLGSPASF